MGPMQVERLDGKMYAFFSVDVFSRYIWVKFLIEKLDTFKVFRALCLQLQKEQDIEIVRIRNDHGREFENVTFNEFNLNEGILYGLSAPLHDVDGSSFRAFVTSSMTNAILYV